MIHFRKPFSRVNNGMSPDSIIAYKSRPYSYGDDYDEIRKQVYIDLWLMTFMFGWNKKAPPTRSQKIYGQIGKKGLK